MADYALLEKLGVGKEFNFRYEIGKYRGCGLSEQELEEEGSDIVLMAFLEWDRDETSGAEFYSYCRKSLRGLLRLAEKRSHMVSLSSLDEQFQGEVLLDTRSAKETESLRNLMDARFMETIESIFEEVFSDKQDAKYLEIARKYFLEQKTVREVAAELGQKYTEQIHRQIKLIRSRFREYVHRNSARIYSYFDERLADVIMDFASV